MRKRIEELAEGKVECIGQDVIFSVSRIEIETYAGEEAWVQVRFREWELEGLSLRTLGVEATLLGWPSG